MTPDDMPEGSDPVSAFVATWGLTPDAESALRDMVAGLTPGSSGTLAGMFEDDAPPPLDPLARYADRGLLGKGGMGEVRRVRDSSLDREVALKTIRADLPRTEGLLGRFKAEAMATARLQHPGVAPVHEIGALADGRPFFTLREIRGETLGALLAQRRLGRGPALRRIIEDLRVVCDTVAYAHAAGVVHRDLKPDNVMVGPYGEVLVVDWGLAAAPGAVPRGVSGTPEYMAPEQARGEAVGTAADVWSLGAILSEILASDGARVPELEALAARASASDPRARPSASAVSEGLMSWLDGARRKQDALEAASAASARLPGALEMRRRAEALRRQASAALADVAGWEPDSKKEPAWALQDEADELERATEAEEAEVTQALILAAAQAGDQPEILTALTERHLAAHADAEARDDAAGAARAERHLALHAGSFPAGHPVRSRVEAYLRGDGTLTLVTDPPGARVELHRYAHVRRRLVPVFERDLGETPLVEVPLPRGRWLLTIHAEGREAVRYPVHIGRQERWDGVRPGGSAPHPIVLPPAGSLGPDDLYVPAGFFRYGGDPEALESHPAERRWLDGFLVRRNPVTVAEYFGFLQDLHDRGDLASLDRHAPKRNDGRPLIAEGSPVPPADWFPDAPIVQVDWHSSRAYAAWEAARTGKPWRLPFEVEWEKAARGVDGRRFPWGDFFDPSWCRMALSLPGFSRLARVGEHPEDESPYGVRGMAGNVRDWCEDLHDHAGEDRPEVLERRSRRGGAWDMPAQRCRSATRMRGEPISRKERQSFRLFASL